MNDTAPRIGRKAYESRLAPLQRLMRLIALSYHRQGLSAAIVVEGTDTAGKGGAIHRLTAELDPRFYRVWPIAAPSPDELQYHYLWRFWQRLPGAGAIAIFDRSWYGRVLVERIDNLAPEKRWREAYDEINAFESLLAADGMRLVKIYLEISREEQQKRLLARASDPHRFWKISTADLRAHVKFDDYAAAAADMLEKTSTEASPWHVIEAEDKKHARIAMLEIVTEALGRDVELDPGPLDAETARLARDVLS